MIAHRGALAALLVATCGASALDVRRDGDRFRDPAGRVVPLCWAAGPVPEADLAAYRQTGMTVVCLELGGPAATAPEDLARAAERADDAGLAVLLVLNAVDAVRPGQLLPLDRPEAVAETSDWIRTQVAAYKGLPGLLGYGLQHEAEERLVWSPAAFADYLKLLYGDLDTLNAVWGSRLASFEEVQPATVSQLDLDSPSGISRAAMDVARWRQTAVAALHQVWCDAVAAEDPLRPIFGGRMRRLRSLLNASPSLAGLQPSTPPYSLGRRAPAFPAEMVACAHQDGEYAVVPTIDDAVPTERLDEAVAASFARGACGVAFGSWASLRAARARWDRVRLILNQAADGVWAGFQPRPAAAVVLQPYVRGPQLGHTDLVGYGSFGGDEPAGLLELLRAGTRHGPLAVITPRALGGGLERYGCLFAPALIELSQRAVQALRAYVADGGVLFADLGLGCYSPRGSLADMPAELAEVFGFQIAAVRPLAELALSPDERVRLALTPPGGYVFGDLDLTIAHPGSLRFLRRSSYFPSIQPVVYTSPAMSRPLLLAPVALGWPTGGGRIVAEQRQGEPRRDGRPAVAGLVTNAFGRGVAIFWGTFAWQEWDLGESTFEAVTGDLLRRDPELFVREEPLVPNRVQVARGRAGLLLRNRLDAATTVDLDLPSHEPRLGVGGLNQIIRPELLPGGPAPGTARWGFVLRRMFDLGPRAVLHAADSPLTLWPQAAEAAARLTAYDSERIDLLLYGGGPPGRALSGEWMIDPVERCEVTLRVDDGPYRLVPGSLHRAVWRVAETVGGTPRDAEERWTLTVTEDATLIVTRAIETARLTITPILDRPAGAPVDEE